MHGTDGRTPVWLWCGEGRCVSVCGKRGWGEREVCVSVCVAMFVCCVSVCVRKGE